MLPLALLNLIQIFGSFISLPASPTCHMAA